MSAVAEAHAVIFTDVKSTPAKSLLDNPFHHTVYTQ